MSPRSRRIVIKPSPWRFALWGVFAVTIGVLAFWHDPGILGKRLEEARRKARESASEVDRDAGSPRRPGEPVLRLAVMARAAHSVFLLGLEMEWFDVAMRYATGGSDDAWIETRMFRDPAELERRFANGELDAAAAPWRSAIALLDRMGERAPLVVCGSMRGDERLVMRNTPPDTLDGARIAVVFAPRLDIEAALEGASVVLAPRASIPSKILARQVQGAIAPEPLASGIAALSGSAIVDPAEVGARFEGGSLLLLSRDLVENRREIAAHLVQAHEVACSLAAGDPAGTIERARAAIERNRFHTEPVAVWQKAMEGLSIDSDIPTDALKRLHALAARTNESLPPLEAILHRELLDEARRIEQEAEEGN